MEKTKLHEGFIGVFSPSGELEAVESTPTDAEFSRTYLSPDKKYPNRVLDKVTVLRGDLGDVLLELLLEASASQVGRSFAAFSKIERECTTIDEKSGRPVVVTTAEYHSAREKLITAVRLESSLV